MTSRLMVNVLLMACLAAGVAGPAAAQLFPSTRHAEQAAAPGGWDVSAQAGAGYWAGNVTYRIGGHYRDSDGMEGSAGFPISELSWPISVYAMSGELRARTSTGWDISAAGIVSLSQDSGVMKDSDWDDETDPQLKTIYSESDARLDAWGLEFGARYWFAQMDEGTFTWSLAAGLVYRHQQLDWEARDVDQWYPPNPEEAHDRVDGVVGTYAVAIDIPFVEMAARLKTGDVALEFALGLSPMARVSDADDHVLRQIRARTVATGSAWQFSATAQYRFIGDWFAYVSGQMLGLEASGTEKDHVYGGMDEGARWEIDHEIAGTQSGILCGVGLVF